jgi:hypothetical protein
VVSQAVLLLLTATRGPGQVIDALRDLPEWRIMRREAPAAHPATGVPKAPPDVFTVACERRDVVVEDTRDATKLTDRLRDRLDGLVDPVRSAALVAADHVLLPWEGTEHSGTAILIYAMRRLPSLTPEQFHEYWLGTHASFGYRALAGHGYRQLHADRNRSSLVAGSVGIELDDFDGAVASTCGTWEAYRDDRATPEKRAASAAALADEVNFIDHARSMSIRYTVV